MENMLSYDSPLLAMFTDFEKTLSEERDQKEKIKEAVQVVDQKAQKLKIYLQQMHQQKKQDYLKMAEQAYEVVKSFKSDIEDINVCLNGVDEPYLLTYMWLHVMSKVSYVACLCHYIMHSELLSLTDLWRILGISEKGRNLFLNIEEYLMGVLNLCSELSRFAINCVTMEDYAQPGAILAFISEVESGFSLLNLKNNDLRKRFDGLKYDLKKVEQVTYDLKIRGMLVSKK